MSPFNVKQVSDAVHGTIGLSGPEIEIIDTPCFQRLRNVRQLGLAHYVFPGADYSRFAHSLGVCHVTGALLTALRDNASVPISDSEIQRYRLAALLHDVGHYPFSHTMEHAIKDHNASFALIPSTPRDGPSPRKPYTHEHAGKEIVRRVPEIAAAIARGGFAPSEIYSIFTREEQPSFGNLVSSDLDADRLDYMLRTAHHTGLPYGSVDLPYLLSQIRVDNDGHPCLTEKAIAAADHFLLCRYFDYKQVAFHKSVAGLEKVLSDVLRLLLKADRLPWTADAVDANIDSREWNTMDDSHVIGLIRAFEPGDEVERRQIQAITERNAPKLICAYERIGPRDDDGFNPARASVERKLDDWSRELGIDRRLWYFWVRQNAGITATGSHVPISTLERMSSANDEYAKSIRIRDSITGGSRPLAETSASLMHVLADRADYAIRVYVLLAPCDRDLKSRIREHVLRDDIGITWRS